MSISSLAALQTLCRDLPAGDSASAAAVVARYFPDAAKLYAARHWRLPASI